MSNSGTSINFDAQALHDAEEAEYHREEREREKELRAALLNAFDDDLSDEDSDLSHGQGTSVLSEEAGKNIQTDNNSHGAFEIDPEQTITNEGVLQSITSQAYIGPSTSTPYTDNTRTGPPHTEHGTTVPHPSHTVMSYPGHSTPHAYTGQVTAYPDHTTVYTDHTTPYSDHTVTYTDHSLTPCLGHTGLAQHAEHITSTPLNALGAPPLATPAPDHYGNLDWNPSEASDNNNKNQDVHYANYPGYTLDRDQYYGDMGQVPAGCEMIERGEIEGANAEDVAYVDQHNYQGVQSQQQQQPSSRYPYDTEYHVDYMYPPTSKHVSDSHGYKQNEPAHAIQSKHPDFMSAKDAIQRPASYLPVSKDTATYKVTYQGAKTSARHGEEGDQNKRTYLAKSDSPGQYADLQEEFLNTGSNHQVEQLQILYAARGRKLEEISEQLKALQEDSAREIRILKHKLTLAQDERDGLSTSLEQCQQMLRESRQRETELQGQVAALESQVEALNAAKEQLISKLQTYESTIESLNAQLINLEASESLSRARQQHENIVSEMKEKHQNEIFMLNERLDKCQKTVEDKNLEIDSLKKQVTSLLKSSEEAQIHRADTVNQLARSLEESQRQCQHLLESGQGQELSKLKLQLQDVIASKSITEDLNHSLQEEIKELKEQVMLYESMTQLGLFTNTTASSNLGKVAPPAFDDSYAQLGIKTSDSKPQVSQWRTPDSNRSATPTLSSEDTIHALKTELERCLAMYKQKRELVTELQDKVKSMKTTVEDYKTKQSQTEQELKETKEKLKAIEEKIGDCITASNPREALAKKELEALTAERDMLAAELKEVRMRLEEVATNEEKASELNQELRTQMSQMIQEFDEDKRQALEKCQEAVQQHYEDTRRRWEKELEDQFQKEKTELEKEWQEKYDVIVNQLSAIQNELDEVKNLYVTICSEKDKLEGELRRKFEEKLQQEIKKVKEEFEQEKQKELEHLLASKKEEWKKEEELRMARAIESEVTSCKARWFEEHQSLREQAVERALKVNNLEWQHKWDSELYKQIEEELNKVQENWSSRTEAEFQRRLEEKLASAKQEWMETELVKAKEGWKSTELQQAIDQAKQAAVRETEEKLKENHEKAVTEALETAKKQWESERLSTIGQNGANLERLHCLEEKCESLKLELDQLKSEKSAVEEDLMQKTIAWQRERAELIKQKDAERREAVLKIQQQTEEEYKQFLSEHQDTLNKALTSAREQCRHEKEILEKQYLAELETLKQSQKSSVNFEEKLQEERQRLFKDWESQLAAVTNEHKKLHDQWESRLNDAVAENEKLREQWEARLADTIAEHEEEKQQLLILHRENMAKALEEARSRWQKKLDNILQQTDRNVLLECKKQWEEERAHYLAIIEEREQLLQTADEHMETEITKLHEQLKKQLHESNGHSLSLGEDSSQYWINKQGDFNHHLENIVQIIEDNLGARHKPDVIAEINKLQKAHENELQSLVDELQAKHKELMQNEMKEVEKKLNMVHEEEKRKAAEEVAETRAEMEKILTKLEDTRKQLKELYGKYTKDTRNMARKIELQTQELNDAQKQIEEYEQQIRELKNMNETLQVTVDDLNRQLEKAEKLRQEVVESLKRSEKEHEEIINSYKTRCAQLAEKIQRIESELNTVKAEAHQRLVIMQQSMEREHTLAIENLKVKLVQIKQKHDENIRQMQEQHEIEKERLLKDLSKKDDSTIYNMRDQYLEAVEKIREDVLKHLSQSNEQAALTLQVQVMRERQVTARRLRRYYMKCLAHLLDKDCDPVTKEDKLSAMERYLDNLPERDASRSTTPSVPSSTSKPSTPVSISQVPGEQSRSYEMTSSSSELQEEFRRRWSKPSWSRSNFTSSSQPSSTTDSGRESWITLRSHANVASSMTYPLPAVDGSQPSHASGQLPPSSSSEQQKRQHGRHKAPAQQTKAFKSPFRHTFNQSLSASTPNLTPRHVSLSEFRDEEIQADPSSREAMLRTSDCPSLLNSGADSQFSNTMKTQVHPEMSSSKQCAYREQSPMDDILNKYAIGPMPQRPVTAEDIDLPDSTQSTPGRHLKESHLDRGQIFRTKSSEFLNKDMHLKMMTSPQSRARGYKYTPLCGILSARGQSRSSTQLHSYETESNLRMRANTPPATQHRTPPERMPSHADSGTPPRPHFVPRLQLKSLDIDLNQSDNFQSSTPRADQEVATLNQEQAWAES